MSRRRMERTEERGADRLAAFALRWIQVVAFLIGATATFLELKNTPLDGFARSFDNSSLMKIGLFIFFFGWWWGATQDTKIMREGYCKDPDKGDVGVMECLGIVVFVMVFLALFFLHGQLIWFQSALLAFIVVNSWTWWIIFRRTRKLIDASYEKFSADEDSKDNCKLAKLLLVVQYINGPWQRYRFMTLILLAALQVVAAILVARGTFAPALAGIQVNGVPAAVLVGYLPGVLFILYVLVSEIWMKIYRIKLFADLNTIDYLDEHFTISKQREGQLPTPHKARFFDFSDTANQNYVGHGPLAWFFNPD